MSRHGVQRDSLRTAGGKTIASSRSDSTGIVLTVLGEKVELGLYPTAAKYIIDTYHSLFTEQLGQVLRNNEALECNIIELKSSLDDLEQQYAAYKVSGLRRRVSAWLPKECVPIQSTRGLFMEAYFGKDGMLIKEQAH